MFSLLQDKLSIAEPNSQISPVLDWLSSFLFLDHTFDAQVLFLCLETIPSA